MPFLLSTVISPPRCYHVKTADQLDKVDCRILTYVTPQWFYFISSPKRYEPDDAVKDVLYDEMGLSDNDKESDMGPAKLKQTRPH